MSDPSRTAQAIYDLGRITQTLHNLHQSGAVGPHWAEWALGVMGRASGLLAAEITVLAEPAPDRPSTSEPQEQKLESPAVPSTSDTWREDAGKTPWQRLVAIHQLHELARLAGWRPLEWSDLDRLVAAWPVSWVEMGWTVPVKPGGA